MSEMLEVRGLSAAIAGTPVLNDAALSVAPGSFTGLVGRNGAGKTTVMRAVMGLLPVRAGQFFLWRFKDGPGWSRAHPWSLSAAPRTDRLRITVKNVGDGSARVARLRPGTRVFVEGPFGALTGAKQRGGKVLLMAAGVGITALRALLEDLEYEPGDATLIYRVSSETEAVFGDELDDLADERGAQVIYVDGARGRRHSWLPADCYDLEDDEALRRLVPGIEDYDAYLCGPPPWMDACRIALRQAGVPAGRIHLEEFAW